MLLLEFDSIEVSVMQHSASDCPSGLKTYFGFNWHNKDHIFQANAKRSIFIVSWLCKKARNKMLKSFPLPHQSFGIMGNILAHSVMHCFHWAFEQPLPYRHWRSCRPPEVHRRRSCSWCRRAPHGHWGSSPHHGLCHGGSPVLTPTGQHGQMNPTGVLGRAWEMS